MTSYTELEIFKGYELRLPQVQLVDTSAVLPFYYRRGAPRQDIRLVVIAALVFMLERL